MTQSVYIVRPAVFAPTILSVIAVATAIQESWWFLAALPFIWLGSVCAQPNLNLADGCLAYLAMIIGFGIGKFFKPLGFVIFFATILGFYLSAIEKRICMRPAHEIPKINNNDT